MEEAKTRYNDYDQDKDGNITVEEFVNCYLQDEEYCKQQIQNCKRMIEEGEKQRLEFDIKLKEAKVRPCE